MVIFSEQRSNGRSKIWFTWKPQIPSSRPPTYRFVHLIISFYIIIPLSSSLNKLVSVIGEGQTSTPLLKCFTFSSYFETPPNPTIDDDNEYDIKLTISTPYHIYTHNVFVHVMKQNHAGDVTE